MIACPTGLLRTFRRVWHLMWAIAAVTALKATGDRKYGGCGNYKSQVPSVKSPKCTSDNFTSTVVLTTDLEMQLKTFEQQVSALQKDVAEISRVVGHQGHLVQRELHTSRAFCGSGGIIHDLQNELAVLTFLLDQERESRVVMQRAMDYLEQRVA